MLYIAKTFIILKKNRKEHILKYLKLFLIFIENVENHFYTPQKIIICDQRLKQTLNLLFLSSLINLNY